MRVLLISKFSTRRGIRAQWIVYDSFIFEICTTQLWLVSHFKNEESKFMILCIWNTHCPPGSWALAQPFFQKQISRCYVLKECLVPTLMHHDFKITFAVGYFFKVLAQILNSNAWSNMKQPVHFPSIGLTWVIFHTIC